MHDVVHLWAKLFKTMKLKNWVFGFIAVFSATFYASVVFAQANAKMILAATVKGAADGTPVALFPSTIQGLAIPPTAVKNGTFTLEMEMPQPDLFILIIGNASDSNIPRYQVFLDNEVVEIAIDVSNNSMQINKGLSAAAFTELLQQFGPEFDQLTNISKQRQQAGNSGFYSDSLGKAFDAQLDKIAKMIPGFVTNYSQSPVSAFLLNTVWPVYMNVPQMDGWIGLLSVAAKESVFGKALEEQMGAERMLGYGQVAPDFIQNDQNGNPVSLKDFRGKYVLVDFWASWCGPCRVENPHVVSAYQRYKNKNFTVLGVSLDRDKPKWLQAIKDDNLTWAHVSDLKFWQNEVAKIYKVSSIPQNYLLDPEGRIIGKNLRGAALDEFLNKTLGAN